MRAARWVDVVYEDLVERPAEELRRLFDSLGLPFAPAVSALPPACAANVARTSLTAPRREKWRDENRKAIERILPLAGDRATLGYTS